MMLLCIGIISTVFLPLVVVLMAANCFYQPGMALLCLVAGLVLFLSGFVVNLAGIMLNRYTVSHSVLLASQGVIGLLLLIMQVIKAN